MYNVHFKAICRLCAIIAVTLAPYVRSYGQTDSLRAVTPYVTDVRELLTGQTPGAVTVSSVGAPWMVPTVYVRGLHLFNENPLYYVDGVLVYDLGYLAPESIQSIDVLSGADAVRRYGPEAVNGVLAITTKNASRSGFHISYGFTGAIQQLAWEPEQVTLEEWKQYRPMYYGMMNVSQNPYLLDKYKMSLAQTHHLDLQYGGDKLNFAAGFDFLDNDGPLEGRNDSKRRYSGNASIDYRPMVWLRVNLNLAAGRSDIYYWNSLSNILRNEPVKEGLTPENPMAVNDNRAINNVQSGQALVEMLVLPGLTFRTFYGMNRDKQESDTYFKRGDKYGFDHDWTMNQYGLDSDYSMSFDNHTVQLGVTYKKQAINYKGNYSSPAASSTSHYNFERVNTFDDLSSNINYNWNKKLFLGLGIYQRWWKEKPNPPKYPSLAAQLRWDSGNNWSVFASWSQFYSYYQSPFRSLQAYIDPAKYSRIDAGADASFALGRNTLGLYVKGFFDTDSYYLEDDSMDIENSGLETKVQLSGQSGDLRYDAGVSLTLYSNKVKSLYPNIHALKYHDENLQVREGYPVGIAWLKPFLSIERETGLPSFGDQQQAFGNGVFPTSALGLHGSLAWKDWQLSVYGHGNFGQSVIHPHVYDLLTRYYLENSWTTDNMDAIYPDFSWYGEVCRSSAALLNASFFKIDQIRLDYTLPIKRFSGYINLFVSLENYFLFTSYPGSDPEYLLDWDNCGVESGSYPSTKRIVTGLKISF